MLAMRVLAPALTTTAVRESDPQEGADWKIPPTALAAPKPMKSLFGSALLPSGLR